MRTPSRTVARAALVAADRETWLYRHALTLTQNQTPVAGETVREAPGLRYRYRLTLYAPRASYGGIVLSRFIAPGQATTVTAYYLDDLRAIWLNDRTAVGLAFRIAVERLVAARDAAWAPAEPTRAAVCPGRGDGQGHATRADGTCAFCYDTA